MTSYTNLGGGILTTSRFQPASDRPGGVEKGGGGGHDGGMDDLIRRVAALEGDVKDIKATLTRFEPLLTRIDERIKDMPSAKEFGEVKGRVMQLPTGEAFGELKGKLSQVPSWWQMAGIILAAGGLFKLAAKFFQ